MKLHRPRIGDAGSETIRFAIAFETVELILDLAEFSVAFSAFSNGFGLAIAAKDLSDFLQEVEDLPWLQIPFLEAAFARYHVWYMGALRCLSGHDYCFESFRIKSDPMERGENVGLMALHRCEDELCWTTIVDRRNPFLSYDEAHHRVPGKSWGFETLEIIVHWRSSQPVREDGLEEAREKLTRLLESFFLDQMENKKLEMIQLVERLGEFEIGKWCLGADRCFECPRKKTFTQPISVSLGMLSEHKNYLSWRIGDRECTPIEEKMIEPSEIAVEIHYPFGTIQTQRAKNVFGFTRREIYYIVLFAAKELYREEMESCKITDPKIVDLLSRLDSEKGSLSEEERSYLNRFFGLLSGCEQRPLTSRIHSISTFFLYDLWIGEILYSKKDSKIKVLLMT